MLALKNACPRSRQQFTIFANELKYFQLLPIAFAK
jgi:hypothetical protein